ncbi:pentapeptide repeat-containing protein, partial [Campylobacter lari]
SFAVSRFKGETLFANISSINNILEFNQVEFNRVKFVNTAELINSYYFLNSTFKSIVNFENLNINDLIFYNVVFENIVTFDKVKFNNKPNFENCTFSNQFNIEHKYIQYDFQDLQYKTNNITDKYKALLDARDLFRKLKGNRIAHHNLIDASELRAQELYTRELELKYKENKSLKEKIERWQLFFYRKLCEHHTDILQSLNSLILVIGIFGMLNLSTIIGFNCYLGYKPILEHLYFSLDFYNFHIKPFIENNHLFIVFVNFLILFLYLILVGFALCEKYIRKFFITISYVITLFIMITSPKIFIPAMGIFTDKRVMLDPLSVLGGIYTIVFGFVVYSFVKTIRKNSIVPS